MLGFAMSAASSCVGACAPAPQIVMTFASDFASSLIAMPPEAPVRIVLIAVPSATATGSFVSGSFKMIVTLALGRPFLKFIGPLPIHLMPAMSYSPPMYPGMALIRPSMFSSSTVLPQRSTHLPGLMTSPVAFSL